MGAPLSIPQFAARFFHSGDPMTALTRNKAAAIATSALVSLSAGSALAATCSNPTRIQGFETCADVAAAKKEGRVVLYAVAGQDQQIAVLNEFGKLFPEIKVQSIWAQTGSLYTKVKQEIRTKNTLVDVLSLSDPTLLNEMQRANDLAQYGSPELKHYSDPNVQSKPKGYWTSWGMVATAIVYNAKTIGANPPTSWKDLTDKRYAGRANLKNTTSGLQFAQWKTLADVNGPEYWTSGISALKPVAFDSFTQQFDRIVSGEDLVAINGQISGAMQYIEKGAPLKIVYPKEGIPATLEGIAVVGSAPHPQAARLLVDWLLSKPGQDAIVKHMQYFSPRGDAVKPLNSGAPADVKFLVPDWDSMTPSRPLFEAAWKKVLGR
jgi:iron(III) transport system substrate-binding protein